MPSACSLAIESARSQAASYRERAMLSRKDVSIPQMMAGGFPNNLEAAFGQNLVKHSEQYRHFQGWPFVAIHRIASRLAAQKIKMGRKIAEPSLTSWAWDRPPGRKIGFLERMKAPDFVKSLDTDIEQIETHPLLDAVQNPNDIMTSWSLIFSTIASLELTGRAYWWFIEEDDGRLSIWPLPSDWVIPIHSEDKLRKQYRIRPNGNFRAETIVDGNEVALFSLPDPSDPNGAISPLQTQAPAVAIDESIQSCQHRFFDNGIFPGVLLRAGRLPSMTGIGEGMRPVLTGPQRRELFEAVRAVYQSSVNYHEPFIVDGLIEDIQKFTNNAEEMDFIASATFNKTRIFQAFGVNPFIAGEIAGVNKAQAVVAESVFNTNVIAPLATLVSQVMSKHIGEKDVYFWLELPNTDDPAQKLANVVPVLQYGVVTKGWYRQEMLGIPPADDGTDEEYIQAPSGGGFGGAPFGGGGFGGPPKPETPQGKPGAEGTGEKPEGEQGTPAEDVEAGGGQGAAEAANPPGKALDKPNMKGGPGSGNFGHAGRPGDVGGSGGGGESSVTQSKPLGEETSPRQEKPVVQETLPKGVLSSVLKTKPDDTKAAGIISAVESRSSELAAAVAGTGKPLKFAVVRGNKLPKEVRMSDGVYQTSKGKLFVRDLDFDPVPHEAPGRPFAAGQVDHVTDFGRNPGEKMERVAVHEMAHHVAYAGGSEAVKEMRAMWQRSYSSGKFISRYASTHPEENFAEAVAAYVYHPNELKAFDPETHAAIGRVLKNVGSKKHG